MKTSTIQQRDQISITSLFERARAEVQFLLQLIADDDLHGPEVASAKTALACLPLTSEPGFQPVGGSGRTGGRATRPISSQS